MLAILGRTLFGILAALVSAFLTITFSVVAQRMHWTIDGWKLQRKSRKKIKFGFA